MWVCKFSSEEQASWEPRTDTMSHFCGKTETSLTTNNPYKGNQLFKKRYIFNIQMEVQISKHGIQNTVLLTLNSALSQDGKLYVPI